MPHHLSLSPQKGPTPPTLPKSAHPAEGAPTPQAWAGRLRKRTIEDLEASGSDVLDRATRRRLGTSRPTTKQFSHPPVLPKQQAPGAEEAQKIGRKTRRARDQGLRTSARSVITTRKTTRTSRQRPKKHSQSRNPRQEDLRRNAIEESLCASVEAPEDIPRPRTVKDCPRQVSEFIPQSAFEPEPLANKWTSTTRDPAAAGARKLTVDAVALLNGERDPVSMNR